MAVSTMFDTLYLFIALHTAHENQMCEGYFLC